VFAEPIEVADQEIFKFMQKLAYEQWQRRGRPLWDADHDWYEAERLIIEDRTILDRLNNERSE
jgi:hypothetical protein